MIHNSVKCVSHFYPCQHFNNQLSKAPSIERHVHHPGIYNIRRPEFYRVRDQYVAIFSPFFKCFWNEDGCLFSILFSDIRIYVFFFLDFRFWSLKRIPWTTLTFLKWRLRGIRPHCQPFLFFIPIFLSQVLWRYCVKAVGINVKSADTWVDYMVAKQGFHAYCMRSAICYTHVKSWTRVHVTETLLHKFYTITDKFQLNERLYK